MTEMACAKVSRPALTNETVITVVAVEDCTDAVTSIPVNIPVKRLVVFEALARAGQEADVERDAERHEEQQRHHDLVGALDAALHAEDDDQRAREDEQQPEAERRERRGDEAAEEGAGIGDGFRGGRAAADDPQVGPEVLEHPAADDAVVGHDDDRDDRGEDAEDPEAAVQLRVGRQLALPRRAPDRDFGRHQREAERHDEDEVHEDERASAVLRR